MQDQVHIQFANKKSAAAFFKWFIREGFSEFEQSKEAQKAKQAFCLSEETPAGKESDMFYFEIESTN